MSETDNIKIIQNVYANYQKGDLDSVVETFSEDIKWNQPAINRGPFTGARSGRESIREFFEQLSQKEEFSEFEAKEFISKDDKVIVLGHAIAKVIATGKTFESDWVHIFTIKDNQIKHFKELFDTAALDRAYQRSVAAS